jgi:hypothetical protein
VFCLGREKESNKKEQIESSLVATIIFHDMFLLSIDGKHRQRIVIRSHWPRLTKQIIEDCTGIERTNHYLRSFIVPHYCFHNLPDQRWLSAVFLMNRCDQDDHTRTLDSL